MNDDICGFCGEAGADKIPHPIRWPGEQNPNSELVHAECETIECARAHQEYFNKVGDVGVRNFLRNI
jgi:hypothetical protein